MENITIRQVQWTTQLDQVRELVKEYIKTIPYDISFQDIAKELEDMPGKYVPEKKGMFLAAYYNTELVGCVAYRQMDEECCEMKRLYVRPAFRNKSVGAGLVNQLIKLAKEKYKKMRLDSIEQFKDATRLYQKFGFKRIGNYNQNPIDTAVFYEKTL